MLLSVVVTIVDGGDALARCLDALFGQQPAGPMEVLVPYDSSVPGMAAIASRFPGAVLIDLGELPAVLPKSSPGGQHELFDRRRAAGLSRARGELVAILEDRGVPRRNWSLEVRRLHTELPQLVIGGAIENGRDRLLNWAVYFCDFGRYQLPFAQGPRDYVSDVNVCYKREALERTRHLWQERYHEPVVHGALVVSGERLILSPDPIVDQHRDQLRLGSLVLERIAWGRLFATLRVRAVRPSLRLPMALFAPFLPALLAVRLGRLQLQKKKSRFAFAMALPAVLTLLTAWSVGELIGYLTGPVTTTRPNVR